MDVVKSQISGHTQFRETGVNHHHDYNSLIDLPLEIIENVIYWLTRGNVNIFHRSGFVQKDLIYPEFIYKLNRVRCVGHYLELIALSSTCIRLRQLLAPFIFTNLSLIRLNNIDVILGSHWGQSELFSDKKKYQREFMKELLGNNFDTCLVSDLARTSFKQGVIGDGKHQSRYQRQFSMNNFITYLESDSTILSGSDLQLFPNVTSLKIFDSGFFSTSKFSFLSINKLTNLSIRGDILSNVEHIPSSIKRLDVILIFLYNGWEDTMKKLHTKFETDFPNLIEFNLFTDTKEVLNYDETLNLLEIMADNCVELESINFRKLRRNVYVDSSRILSNSIYNSLNFFKIIKKFEKLRFIGTDLKILNAISDDTLFVDNLKTLNSPVISGPSRCFTIIDHSTTIPMLNTNAIKLLSDIIRSGGFNELHFQFNESHNKSRDNAINLILSVVSFQTQIYQKQIERVSIMPCWSLTDGHLKRTFYRDCILKNNENPSKVWQQSLASALIGDKISTNSGKYRDKEIFDVKYMEYSFEEFFGYPPSPVNEFPTILQAKLQPNDINNESHHNEYSTSRAFWSVESSLSEMEHYSTKADKGITIRSSSNN
ncbi:hypothetical protein DFJ63DRAFT_330732 [Scheffersomyces coipomensis]|uniref:uncharacterized protein n=1 Tax=Scheffersomyces coipomensis TaxID=1788519 RepID=UPI00315C681E